jgi:hypothetical protein
MIVFITILSSFDPNLNSTNKKSKYYLFIANTFANLFFHIKMNFHFISGQEGQNECFLCV